MIGHAHQVRALGLHSLFQAGHVFGAKFVSCPPMDSYISYSAQPLPDLVAAALFGRTHCSRVALISSSQTLLSRCKLCEQVAKLHEYRGPLQWPDAALTSHIK